VDQHRRRRTSQPDQNVQENYGKAAPAPTFEDMIRTAHDEALFEYYFASQLAAINIASGKRQ